MGSLDLKVCRSILVAAALLSVAAEWEARAGDAAPVAREGDPAAALKKLVQEGDSASARPDWDAAARAYAEAAKLAPNDGPLRDKLRRALDRRARARAARAANPPPYPAMSDAPPDADLVLIYKDSRWRLQLKREAQEARADAEEAREKPDKERIARLRRHAAQQRAQEDRLSLLIREERKKQETGKAEMEKAFPGVGGVDTQSMPK